MIRLIMMAILLPLLSGCISTAASVVTAPVRAAAQVADWTTTSQDEADRDRGRAMREREEELGRLDRRQQREAARCARGDQDACEAADGLAGRIADLRDAPSPR